MTDKNGRRTIPLRVIFIGVLSLLAGLIYLFPALGIGGLGHLISLTHETLQSGPMVLTAYMIAIANIAIGVGCLISWRSVWIYLLAISTINFSVATIALRNADWQNALMLLTNLGWFVVTALVLYSVLSKKTRNWFRPRDKNPRDWTEEQTSMMI